MGETITMTEGQLGARLRADSKGASKAILRAMFSAAQRGKAFIVKKSPVDRGILRNAWKVIKLSDGVDLVNDQPYAGIVERGSRPFKVSGEGLWALKAWALRRLKVGDIVSKTRSATHTRKGIARKRIKVNSELEQEAESIAWAIKRTFERVGMKGKRFVMHNIEQLAFLMDAEITRSLNSFFNRSLKGSTDG